MINYRKQSKRQENQLQILFGGYKRHRQVTTKLCLVILLGLMALAGVSNARDFEVTDIIEIGPVSLKVGEGPMKFSPSGEHLAYFIGTTLMLADSAGISREVITLDMKPLQFEWMSNGEIVVLEYKSLGGPNDYRRLTRIDINSKETLTLHEHYRDKNPDTPETERILSLKKTIKKHFAYKLGSDQGEEVKFPPSNYKESDQNLALSSDYYLEWGESQDMVFRESRKGLFQVSADGSTSVRIGPYFGKHLLIPPFYSSDLVYVMGGIKILTVEDGTFIDLRNYFEVPEDMDICSFVWSEFNPTASEELLFHRSCYKDSREGEVYKDFIGIFNINSKEIIVLDKLVNMENCRAPMYAPDGLSIAFVSEGTAYVIRRMMK